MVNSYGGTFIGFKAMCEEANADNKLSKDPFADKKVNVQMPEKVVVELVSVERLKVPEVKAPGKVDILVTAFFNGDSVEKAFEHMRQSSKPVEAKYLFDSYTCNFDHQKIVLPCTDKRHIMLYLSYVVQSVAVDGTRNLELKGYGFTKPVPLDGCRTVSKFKEQLTGSDGKTKLTVCLTYTVTTSKEQLGPAIPEDRIGGLTDLYNVE